MTIIDKLATSLNRRDEVPNQELAKKIAASNDTNAIREIFENLSNKNKGIQSDCIKVIDETGRLKPKLIAPYIDQIINLLVSKNNRLQWGAMAALDSITNDFPKKIHAVLPEIISAADHGTVITNDHCVGILIKLCAIPGYTDVFSLLNERLLICPTNQLPMYAENAFPVITDQNKSTFIRTLRSRLGEIEKDTKRLRVERVIKKVNKM